MIRYLTDKEIDFIKWDECVKNSINGHVYACSDCLSTMTVRWSGLVLDDYRAIFPLPWKKKFGMAYVYPPAFTQQFGLIAKDHADLQLLNDFLQAISQHFPLADMNLNEGNVDPDAPHVNRKNYLLDLSASYEKLESAFSRSAKRNIEKAILEGITISEQIDFKEVIGIHQSRFRHVINADKEDYSRLEKWLQLLSEKDMLYTPGAFDKEGNLIAGSVFIRYKNRLTFILNGNTEKSLLNGATHLLLSRCIHAFSASNLILDFEGSDNPDFARFYEQYNAHPALYPFVRINRLPFFLRWIKQDVSNVIRK